MSKNLKETKVCDTCHVEKSITSFSISGRDGYRNRRCKYCVTINANQADKKVCRACDIEKPIDEFPTTSVNGLKASRCKVCKNNNIYIPREKRNLFGKSSYSPPRLIHVTKQDCTDMYIFLRDTLKYDLKSNLSIHEQFCLKYNLTPNNPLNTFPDQYSIEDCFNI
jgi:hypothetical protein